MKFKCFLILVFFPVMWLYFTFVKCPSQFTSPAGRAFLWRIYLHVLCHRQPANIWVCPVLEVKLRVLVQLCGCWCPHGTVQLMLSLGRNSAATSAWCYSSNDVPCLPVKLTSEVGWHSFLTRGTLTIQDIHSWMYFKNYTHWWESTHISRQGIAYMPVYKMD